MLLLAGCVGSRPATPVSTSCAPLDESGHLNVTHVEMKGMAFAPAEVRIPAGTWVTWTNLDSVGHTVTPDDAAKWGNAGSGSDPSQFVNEGQSWSSCFTTPGAYAYHCVPHSSRSGSGYLGMTGKVVVQ